MAMQHSAVPDCIVTPCGREQYLILSKRKGPLAWLRLQWFVLIAGIRDRNLRQR
jgi:hypothetical protein